MVSSAPLRGVVAFLLVWGLLSVLLLGLQLLVSSLLAWRLARRSGLAFGSPSEKHALSELKKRLLKPR